MTSKKLDICLLFGLVVGGVGGVSGASQIWASGKCHVPHWITSATQGWWDQHSVALKRKHKINAQIQCKSAQHDLAVERHIK